MKKQPDHDIKDDAFDPELIERRIRNIDIEHEIPLYCSAIGIADAEPSDRMAMRALERGVRPS